MSRQMCATTVVSQPPRFQISSALERLSQASCTASSASVRDPLHAIGDRPQMRPLGLKGLRQPFRLPRKFVSVGHISSMSFVMVVTYETHSM